MPLIRTSDQLQRVFNQLNHAKALTYDSETSGLDWRTNHIVGHVLTFSPDPADSWYLPVRHKSNNFANNVGPQTATGWNGRMVGCEHDLIKLMDRPDLTITCHYAAFDLKFLTKLGFKMRSKFEDTALYAPMLDEHCGYYSLEMCAHRAKVQAKKKQEIEAYLAQRFPETAGRKDAMSQFWRLEGDDKTAVDYACGDGTTTFQLRDWQWAQIVEQELTKVAGIENRLIPILVRMQVLGIKVSQQRIESLIKEIDVSLKGLYQKFPEDFNPRGPSFVRAWMEDHGVTDWPMTNPSKTFPAGQPSFKELWLEKSDAGRQIIKVRKLENMKASFILPMRDDHMFEGRVHTNFNQLRNDEYGTITGRLSSDHPNLQAIPKRDPVLGPMIRSMFVPDDGMIWGEADYRQIEPRLLAYYSGCKVLMEDFLNNPKADAHMAVTQAMHRRYWDQMSDADKKYARENGKRVNQTLITGGGKGVIVEKYGVDEKEVDRLWRDYFQAMPEIKILQRRAARTYRNRGYVLSLLGRRARIDHPDRDYTAVNRLLQVGNADIIKLKMVEAGEFIESEKVAGTSGVDMLLNCHDAISFQFRPKARKLYEQCLNIMQDVQSDNAVIKLSLPMPVDVGEGKNWAIATYGEPK